MAPLVRRGWSPRGYRPLLYQRGGSWEKVSIIAALVVNPQRNRVHLYFRLHPGCNITAQRASEFLAQLLHQLPGHGVLLWDRLRAHRSRRVQARLAQSPRLHPEFFPPYAPELNPTKYVWSYLKTNPLANLPLYDLDSLTTTARHHTRSLQRKPNLLRSFLRLSPLSLRLT